MTDLTQLTGIGEKRARLFNNYGIYSVEKLSEWTDAPQNLQKFVKQANAHMNIKLQQHSEHKRHVSETKQEQPQRSHVLYIKNHTWWKRKIELFLPCQEQVEADRKKVYLDTYPAIVFELCIEPNDRVTMLCVVSLGEEKTKTSKYTPQFIIGLNGHMPKLEVHMQRNEESILSSIIPRQAFQSTLIETNILHFLSNTAGTLQ